MIHKTFNSIRNAKDPLTARKNADTYSIRVDRPYSHLLMQVSRSRLQLDKQLKSPSSQDVMQSTCKDSQFSLQFPNSFHPLIPYSDFISNAVPCSYKWTIFVGVFLLKDLRNVSVQDFSKTYSNVDPVLITEKDSFLE